MIDGRRLGYLERAAPGARRSLVLLHAFPFSAEMWAPQFEAVPDRWRVLAPDFRGFGSSDTDRGDLASAGLTVEDYARDVLGLLDALEVRSAVVAGLSLGGYVAFALLRLLGASPRPPAVERLILEGLVLADTRPQADTDEGRAGRVRMAELVQREGTAAVARAMLPMLVADDTRRRDPDVVERMRALILAARPEAIRAALFRMMDRPDSTPLLDRIACPTLVVVGERDTLTPPDVSREMQARISGATLEILPGVGHMSNMESPEAFNRGLVRFLDGV